jgi:hypothetical protein
MPPPSVRRIRVFELVVRGDEFIEHGGLLAVAGDRERRGHHARRAHLPCQRRYAGANTPSALSAANVRSASATS